MEKEMKLAVLIDAENIASKYIEIILSEANSLGNIIYKRIYGNWTTQQMGSWKDVILDNSIQPIQQYSNTNGKNSSDSSLIIDAMDLLYLGRLDGFCIVSSDSDFTRLAARLRESEMFVLGMGEQKTPRSFISACNKFRYLDILYSASSTGKIEKRQNGSDERDDVENKTPVEKHTELLAKQPEQNDVVQEKPGFDIETIKLSLKELTEENSDDDGWIFSGKLGGLLNKRFPDFDVRNFGSRKFVQFVMSLDLFERKRDTKDRKLIYFKLK
ncbi:MAG: NYN domain-containing protein [Oscillospiraceae bacterium]